MCIVHCLIFAKLCCVDIVCLFTCESLYRLKLIRVLSYQSFDTPHIPRTRPATSHSFIHSIGRTLQRPHWNHSSLNPQSICPPYLLPNLPSKRCFQNNFHPLNLSAPRKDTPHFSPRMVNLFDLLQQKIEVFRLEQRYTRRRNRRSTVHIPQSPQYPYHSPASLQLHTNSYCSLFQKPNT